VDWWEGSNPRSTSLEVSTLDITSPMWLIDLHVYIVIHSSNKYIINERSAIEFHWNYLTLVEDTKGATRIRKSKKNRQDNDQNKQFKRTNNDLQNIHIQLTTE
jgi:hypothetical protein